MLRQTIRPSAGADRTAFFAPATGNDYLSDSDRDHRMRVKTPVAPDSPDCTSGIDDYISLGDDELSALLSILAADSASGNSQEPKCVATQPPPSPLSLPAPACTRAPIEYATAEEASTRPPVSKRPRFSEPDKDPKSFASTRTRTYTARKQEIAALTAEMPALEAYLDYLKHQAAKMTNQPTSMQKQRAVNACLRDKVLKQQYWLARVHSALSNMTTKQEKLIPLDSSINLGSDKSRRLAVLRSMKPRVLRDARQFMKAQIEHHDLDLASSEQSSFVSPKGHFCAHKTAVLPLEGITSVKQVFDALVYHLFRSELSLADKSEGELFEGDEDCSIGQGVSRRRLLQPGPRGHIVETNEGIFAHFDTQNDAFGDGREFGVIAIDSVAQDELHPYSPEQRLRQDFTCVITVQTRRRRGPSQGSSSKGRLEVVLARTQFAKLHCSLLPISDREMMATVERIAQRGDQLFEAVQTSLQSQGGSSWD